MYSKISCAYVNTQIPIMLSTPACNYDINNINFGYVCSIVD